MNTIRNVLKCNEQNNMRQTQVENKINLKNKFKKTVQYYYIV